MDGSIYACAMDTQAAEESDRGADHDDDWRAWFVAGIQRGLDDADAGRTISHEEMKREMDDFLASLGESSE